MSQSTCAPAIKTKMTPQAQEFDAFPDLAFGGNDVLSEVASQLALGDLARLLRVSKAWQVYRTSGSA